MRGPTPRTRPPGGRGTACAGWGLAFAFGALSGCFTEPNPNVSFACSTLDPTPCPKGYTCEDDGCCHRDGSDVAASRGQCSLSSALDTDTDDETGESTG